MNFYQKYQIDNPFLVVQNGNGSWTLEVIFPTTHPVLNFKAYDQKVVASFSSREEAQKLADDCNKASRAWAEEAK